MSLNHHTIDNLISKYYFTLDIIQLSERKGQLVYPGYTGWLPWLVHFMRMDANIPTFSFTYLTFFIMVWNSPKHRLLATINSAHVK